MSNFRQSWTFFLATRALIGFVPSAVAWTMVSNLMTMIGTK